MTQISILEPEVTFLGTISTTQFTMPIFLFDAIQLYGKTFWATFPNTDHRHTVEHERIFDGNARHAVSQSAEDQRVSVEEHYANYVYKKGYGKTRRCLRHVHIWCVIGE